MLCRLVDNLEPGCSAFALQFFIDSLTDVEAWQSDGFAKLMAEMSERWRDRALAFSTPMEVVDL